MLKIEPATRVFPDIFKSRSCASDPIKGLNWTVLTRVPINGGLKILLVDSESTLTVCTPNVPVGNVRLRVAPRASSGALANSITAAATRFSSGRDRSSR